jgi:hypothetical protein
MLRPPGYKSLLCVLSLRSNLHHRLPEELDHAVFEWLFARVSCFDRDEALGLFALSLIGERAISDVGRVKEGRGGGCRESGLAYRRTNIRLVGQSVASEADDVLRVAIGGTKEAGFSE